MRQAIITLQNNYKIQIFNNHAFILFLYNNLKFILPVIMIYLSYEFLFCGDFLSFESILLFKENVLIGIIGQRKDFRPFRLFFSFYSFHLYIHSFER